MAASYSSYFGKLLWRMKDESVIFVPCSPPVAGNGWKYIYMSTTFIVIRKGQEVKRFKSAKYYTEHLVPPVITFYDEDDEAIGEMKMEIGDVVRPLVVGFYNPFPPIDQSESKIAELRKKYKQATGLEWEEGSSRVW